MSTSSHYVHGSDSVEQQRLSALNRFINEPSLRELGLGGGERILDVGCGLGQFSRAMARIASSRDGSVIGIERDERQIAEARRQATADGEGDLIEIRQGDVLNPPLKPDEWGSFDLVHTRFLLEHVPDPSAVVRMMVRAARLGGRIVLADDDHDVLRFWPPLPRVESIWQAYLKTYSHFGNDEFIGRKLVALLYDAGAVPVRNTIVFFGSCAGHETWPIAVDNLIGVIEGAAETMVRIGAAMQNEITTAITDFRAWSRLPQAAFWYGICWAEGRRPLENSGSDQ